MLSDFALFFGAWLRNPVRVGAVAPSGRTLATAMTAQIRPESAPVIEYGPGSGALTRALLDRGVPEAALTLVECGREFATLMAARFPSARILRMDASELSEMDVFDSRRAGAAVSGLPVRTISGPKIGAILQGAFRNMRPEGAFFQFTYGFTCPIPRPILDRLGLEAARIGGVMANLPPASVYRIRRRFAGGRS